MTSCVDEFGTFYLGLPGVRLDALDVDPKLAAAMSSAEVVHQLASGGSTVTRRRVPKRTYTMPLAGLDRDMQDVLLRWYLRSYGSGPFVLVDPTIRNQLPMDVALGNAVDGSTVPAGQTLAYGATATPTAAPAAAKVIDWTGAGNGSVLAFGGGQGSGAGDADTTKAAPVIAGEAATVSVWLWADAAVNVDLRVSGRDGDGSAGGDVALTCALTGVPTRYEVTADVGTLDGHKYLLPTVKCDAAGAPVIHACAPQLEYNTAAGDWTVGLGVPRVTIHGTSGLALSTRIGYGDWTYTLGEVG